MYYIVYRITNNLTSKQYIGVHKTSNLQDGYMGSGLLIKRAIEKYGIENFSKEILFEANSAEEMFDKERELIELYDPAYNIQPGGKGGWDYVNERMQDPEYREDWKRKRNEGFNRNKDKFVASLKGIQNFLGKTHTEEAKRKIGEANSKHMSGSGNSQFGTMWITNGLVNKKIRKDDEIPEGWMKGRKL